MSASKAPIKPWAAQGGKITPSPLQGEGVILPPWAAHGFIGSFEALTTEACGATRKIDNLGLSANQSLQDEKAYADPIFAKQPPAGSHRIRRNDAGKLVLRE